MSVSQCADTATIALGLGSCRPSDARKARAGTSSRIRVGEPCETKIVGMDIALFLVRLVSAWLQWMSSSLAWEGFEYVAFEEVAGGAVAMAIGLAMAAAPSTAQTLRMVSHADIKILDPIWTTALITRNHGYMIYDVLFAKDADLKIQPQMAEKYKRLRRQADLDDHLARRAGMERRHAGHRRGLHRVDQALGRARRLRADSAQGHQRHQGDRRQDLRHHPQGAVRPGAGGAGQAVVERALHDAQACRRHRPEQADRRLHRLRPLHLEEGRMEAGREDRLREEPASYKPRSEPPSMLAGGKVAKVDRVEWLAIADPATAVERADGRRDRPDRIAAARPLPAAEGRQEHRAVRLERAGQPDHHALQHAAPAFQQREGAPGRDVGAGAGRHDARPGRRSRDLQDLQCALHLRHQVRQGDTATS